MSSTEALNTVGIIGLGAIGSAFADRLLRAGFDVVGYDVVEAARDAHRDRGGVPASSIADVAHRCDVIITSLPGVDAARDVAAQLAAVNQPRGGTVLETSTFSAAFKAEFATAIAATWHTLDCTVSGHPEMIRDDTYTFYFSGGGSYEPEILAVMNALSGKPVDAGEFGNAATIKLVINQMVISHDVVAAEAMSLATRAGMDPGFAYDLIRASAGSSRIFEIRGRMMAAQEYPEHPSMYSIIVDKDGPLIADMARELRHPVPMFALALQAHVTGMSFGWDGLDPATLAEVYAGRRRPGD
ncbi:NAD(P)-dependent oxidoreductase [Salinibacterium sp. ZJ454]|uniref:NAD(P)-dependent oxidoreductase n=1 Tax=Salinibacterium sp. ZJ454 TaxID=2708339 RepID=UPI00142234D9|nr:NAD(P)-dependent oxidoreductase [Salinibacterium sp. ZJ454]